MIPHIQLKNSKAKLVLSLVFKESNTKKPASMKRAF